MKNSLIFHGHFYQPPREDPDTGILPLQSSARPFHDWNRRITQECYAANTASRVLAPDGRITDIVNNYQYISFNFGPTLLSWLREAAPNVYRKILEADRISMERHNGHGNAIAQSYNHTILPLDPPENRKTQVIWGIKDFEYTFGRKPEGIWLPETAVNMEVINLLISLDIRFIILSPWQADAWKQADTVKWKPFNGQPAPFDRPFRLEGENGTLSVFFYDHRLAEGISFGHFLQNADTLYDYLRKMKSEEGRKYLIHVATDGEVYGHHEPYGDMCLAALGKHIAAHDDFEITNYGAYLEQFPPADLIRLKPGEEGKGTSWSCSHGVSRWYKDCGCSTGGEQNWNQKWRSPLRNGLDDLFLKLFGIYKVSLKTLSPLPPEEVRNRYIEILHGVTGKEQFARQILFQELQDRQDARNELFTMLEGQKFSMFMFTSCGWFFADISGLEPVQNLKYAANAVNLYSGRTKEDLLAELHSRLREAKSNIDSEGTGADILDKEVISPAKGMEYPAAVFALRIYRQDSEVQLRDFGDFSCPEYMKRGGSEIDCTVVQNRTGETKDFFVRIFREHYGGISFSVLDKQDETLRTVSGKEMPEDEKKLFYLMYTKELEKRCDFVHADVFRMIESNLLLSSSLSIRTSDIVAKTAEVYVYYTCRQFFSLEDDRINTQTLTAFRSLMDFAAEHQIEFNRLEVKKAASRKIAFWADDVAETFSSENIDRIDIFLEALRKGGIEPDLAHAQNVLFSLIKRYSVEISTRKAAGDPELLKNLLVTARIANYIGIDADRFKEQILSVQAKS